MPNRYPNFPLSDDDCCKCCPAGLNVVVPLGHIVVGSGTGIMDSGLPLAQLENDIATLNARVDEELAEMQMAIDWQKTYLDNNLITCPQTGRYGQRFSVVGIVETFMSETWLNTVVDVFGPTGILGVHTNCTFWNAQLLDGNIAASAIAIRRSAGGTGANLEIYPRYTSGALGNNPATTTFSFFMASNETDAALRES